jgi:hypothetical protein
VRHDIDAGDYAPDAGRDSLVRPLAPVSIDVADQATLQIASPPLAELDVPI